ncbi:hypothetical protein ELQ90_01205 [Labedella phragmitis]|uniref:Uncharacterized protein n=1 Tax=Labedella phragmitis TaxID=2498849 RepID=A0A444PXG9_9MICO|nr:hypothetical protein [Labedella phragmitis]RWZ52599.1 hypothetical protein ELQ90_01205 [Labedella phragmitis]
MTDEDTVRSRTSTTLFLSTLISGFLLVAGPVTGWYVPPVLAAVAFMVFFALFIRSGARGLRR